MLRITLEQTGDKLERIVLEGRLAGPWAAELERVWIDAVSRGVPEKLTIDLRDVTYADASGKGVLVRILAETHTEFLTSTLANQDLAGEIVRAAQIQH